MVPPSSTTVQPTADHPYPIPPTGSENILQVTLIVPQDDSVSQSVFKNNIKNGLEVAYLEGLSKVGGKRRKRSILDHADSFGLKKPPVAQDKGLYHDTKDLVASSDLRSSLGYLKNDNWKSFQSGLWNLLITLDRNFNNMRVHSRQRRQTVDPSNTTEVVVSC